MQTTLLSEKLHEMVFSVIEKQFELANEIHSNMRKSEVEKFEKHIALDEASETKMIHIQVDADLYPSPRPRATMIQGRPRIYSDKDYTFYKVELADIIKEKFRHSGILEVLDQPLLVTILFKKRIPESYNARERVLALTGNMFPAKKPDLDNYEKTVLDTMNECIFTDDSNIIGLNSFKMYAETEGLEIVVQTLKGYDQWKL